MKDRGGQEYEWVTLMAGGSFSSAAPFEGSHQRIYVISPSRQAEKALGLSGRQLRKYRNRLRRPAK